MTRDNVVKQVESSPQSHAAMRSMFGAFIAVASLLLLPRGNPLGALAGMSLAMLLVGSEVWKVRFRIRAIQMVCIVIVIGVTALAVAVVIANWRP